MTLIVKPLRIVNGIKIFTSDIEENHPDYHGKYHENISSVENKHFWFISRRERIVDSFLKLLPVKSRVLEIGAGTAYIAKELQNAGFRMAVGDLHFSGLLHARSKGIEECYQFDLLAPPFVNEFDGIGMFDVLEHLDNDTLGLLKVSEMLKKGGKLFITVPAHQWLWSRIDNVASHKRRYSKKELIKKVEATGLQIVMAEYFFNSILPLLYIRHLSDGGSSRRRNIQIDNNAESLLDINPLLNRLLLKITRWENTLSKLLGHVPGGSILMVAVKND